MPATPAKPPCRQAEPVAPDRHRPTGLHHWAGIPSARRGWLPHGGLRGPPRAGLHPDPGAVTMPSCATRRSPAPFRWHDGVRWRSYTADIGVEIDDGRRPAVEVKPRKRVIRAGLGRDPSPQSRPAPGPPATTASSSGRVSRSTRLRVANAALVAERAHLHGLRGAEQHTMREVTRPIRRPGSRPGTSGRRRGSRPAPSGPSWPSVSRGEAELADPADPSNHPP